MPDQETGLYYLQNRYYDPEWGRFLNADAVLLTQFGIVGLNQFAYCINNPVRYRDTQGYMPEEDAIIEDPTELLFPDKESLGAPTNGSTPTGTQGGGKTQNSSIGSSSAIHNGGTAQAPKQGGPNSTYTQYSSDGQNNIVSQTTYNEFGMPWQRIDYGGRDHGVGLPHIHVYTWGLRNGRILRTGVTVSPYRMS